MVAETASIFVDRQPNYTNRLNLFIKINMLARILFWWTTINHNMVVSYGFERCQNPQWQSNAPPSDPVWLVQCPPHWPIKGAQGFTQGHWMPPLGKYLPRIAPADTMVIDFGVKNWVVALQNRFLKLLLAFKRHKTDPLCSSSKQQAA